MFYLSTAGCMFLLFDLARVKFAKYDPQDLNAMDFAFMVLFVSFVFFLVEVLPKEVASKFLSLVHRNGSIYVLCFISTSAIKYLMTDTRGTETLFYVFYFISLLSFIGLYATEEVAYGVSRSLLIFQAAYLLKALITGDHLSVLACGITFFACWIVMVLRLAELRSSPSN